MTRTVRLGHGLLSIGLALVVHGGTAFGNVWPDHRTIDGSGNNLLNPDWGSVGSHLLRMATPSYADGMSEPAGADRPSARVVSNLVCAQYESIPNPAGASDFLWQWGQFIDHDITLVNPADPLEPFDIVVPLGDPMFDPDGLGGQVIVLDRSAHDPATGWSPEHPREQVGSITAFIDASQVYGSDPVRAAALRTLDGTGRLKTSDGNLLPFNLDGLENLGGPDPSLFLAGDIRANEQIGLTSMHTLFMREHNRRAGQIRDVFPQMPGDDVYQLARSIVGAEIQAITYKEFLPLLIGPDAIPAYAGYDPHANPGIANIFATAAYRVGHTLLSPMLMRLGPDGEPIAWGHVPLRDAFFAVDRITDEGGIDPILRGLASQQAQNVDTLVIDDVRNFLFGLPGEGGFDLPSLNLQRGRDHGLPSYNQARIDFELDPAGTFADISPDPQVQMALADAYGDVDAVDVWVGGLAEPHAAGAMVGPLFQRIIADQFRRLRDGDRFWYQRVFHGPLRAHIESIRLSTIIRQNTEIGAELSGDAFRVNATDCTGDTDGNGVVGIVDLIGLLMAWNTDDPIYDLDGDGTVGFTDLVVLLNAWGPCP